MKNSKGFTIIELIVVVAIIAVLATIVLVNVTKYIASGADAGIKANLQTIVVLSSTWIESGHDSYAGFCDNSGVQAALSSMAREVPGEHICRVKTSGDQLFWCACGELTSTTPTGTRYSVCVDSTGYKKERKESRTRCAERCGDDGMCDCAEGQCHFL